MRLFQNARYYPSLRPKIRELTKDSATFAGKTNAFLNFRESAAHILLPVDQRAEWAFFANGDDADIQKVWAREHGLKSSASLEEILRAQIEDHRADVFYNLDATGWEGDFMRRLPGCVKKAIAWHAAPFQNVSFSGYDLVVCNFPSILAALSEQGCRTEYFFPAYDPELAPFAGRQDRPVDVLFVATKATTLEASLERVTAPPGLVVPLLNGLDHLGLLRQRFGAGAVAASVIRIESDRPAPGRIVQTSPSVRVDMASEHPTPACRLPAVAQALIGAGIAAEVREREADVMWAKLVRLNALAATTSVSGREIGFIRSDPQWRQTLVA